MLFYSALTYKLYGITKYKYYICLKIKYNNIKIKITHMCGKNINLNNLCDT